MLDLVESVFLRHGVQNLRYDGAMNRDARETVLARFRRAGGPRVILIRCALPSPLPFPPCEKKVVLMVAGVG